MKDPDEPRLSNGDKRAIERIRRELDRECGHVPAVRMGRSDNGASAAGSSKREPILAGWRIALGASILSLAAVAFLIFWPSPMAQRAPTTYVPVGQRGELGTTRPSSSPGSMPGPETGSPGPVARRARSAAPAPRPIREAPASGGSERLATRAREGEQDQPSAVGSGSQSRPPASEQRPTSVSAGDQPAASKRFASPRQASAPVTERQRASRPVVAASDATREPVRPVQAP